MCMKSKFLGAMIISVIILLYFPAVSSASGVKNDKILFGVIPRYNPIIMYRSYQPLMDYLSENTPYHFELKLARNYQEAVALMRDGVTQFASLGDVTFAEAHDQFGAIPILKPLNSEGEPWYHSIIITTDQSKILNLNDLEGRTFAFGDPHSTSGNLIPRNFMRQQGIDVDAFRSYIHLESHDAVAKAVLKGNVDAGAVKDVVAERYREHGLRFVAISPKIPSVPIVVRQDTPGHIVKAVTEALLKIDPSKPETKKMLESWDPEFSNGFVPATLRDYMHIFDLIDNYPEGCGFKCH